jgi:hypothetical protein
LSIGSSSSVTSTSCVVEAVAPSLSVTVTEIVNVPAEVGVHVAVEVVKVSPSTSIT